ncbi:MAG: FecR domain-containing protein, partial [Ignavibacteriaceae bacterium]
SREVYLAGEAYFEIHHNISRNFIVHTGNLTTTDLGTKFDVSAYPENKTIAVSLLEGKVKVSRNEKGKVGRIAILKPKEQLVYDKENNVSSFNVFDFLEVVGWKDSVYKFVNEPLRKVLPQLERAFGVKFRLTDQSVLAQKITIKFERNSLQTVINVIKSLTGLDYKILKKNNNIKEIVFFRNTK